VRVTGIDIIVGNGQETQRALDVAALTCAPGECEIDASAAGPLLAELGLKR
jgi:hypothetical protein